MSNPIREYAGAHRDRAQAAGLTYPCIQEPSCPHMLSPSMFGASPSGKDLCESSVRVQSTSLLLSDHHLLLSVPKPYGSAIELVETRLCSRRQVRRMHLAPSPCFYCLRTHVDVRYRSTTTQVANISASCCRGTRNCVLSSVEHHHSTL